jgi:hypothetical protein
MLEYMIFEGPGETRGRERMPSGETKGIWRRCLICNVKVYKVPGLHTRDDHSTRGLWVEVDLNEIYVSYNSGFKLIVVRSITRGTIE